MPAERSCTLDGESLTIEQAVAGEPHIKLSLSQTAWSPMAVCWRLSQPRWRTALPWTEVVW